jgi:hypothetical protein
MVSIESNSINQVITMSTIKYVNLFIRGVPSTMEPLKLVKVLSLYGEMNTRPCAISVRYRSYTYSPYMSKEENAIQNNIVSSRYNVVLYGFKVNMDMTANMSHMFLNIIQMKRSIRHAWIDSARQPQYILISENNRPVPPNLFSSLLWSEKLCFSHSGHLWWPPNTTNSEGCFVPGRVWSPETQVKQTVTFVEKKQEVENNLNHAWIDAVEHDNMMTKSSEDIDWEQKYQKYIEKCRLDELEETRLQNDMLNKQLRNDMLYQTAEQSKCSRFFLNQAKLRQEKLESEAEEDALQAAQHAYLVNWASRKEEKLREHNNV